jgi:hypothetical protein
MKHAARDASGAATMNAAKLARWTPIALDLESPVPSIEWANFGRRAFTEPFFDDSVLRWSKENPRWRTVRTGLDSLVVLDQAPSLDPSGFIFHLSRCGSTLLARLLRQIPGCLVISEPESINTVLSAPPAIIDEETRVRLLKLLIRALGRQRLGNERRYVVKLSSWNVRKLELFRRAFPAARLIWLQRNPTGVLTSLLARPPHWLQMRADSSAIKYIFGIAPAKLKGLGVRQFYARALKAMLQAALRASPHGMPTIDYANLPDAAWTTVAPLFGMAPSSRAIARMKIEARYDAKELKSRLFKRNGRIRRLIPKSVKLLAAQDLAPLYEKLSGRPAAKPSLPRSSASRA